LKADGRVFAAGDNSHGQIGDGTQETDRPTPVEITALGSDNAMVAAGLYHSLYLKADGRVFAAGDNSHGQIGDGTQWTNRLTRVG
jgi:alpha-tubulin suppressor-like RCC1 family protein